MRPSRRRTKKTVAWGRSATKSRWFVALLPSQGDKRGSSRAVSVSQNPKEQSKKASQQQRNKQKRKKMSSQYVQLDPVFEVQDWDALQPLLKEGFDTIRTKEPNTYSYAFSECGTGRDEDKQYVTVNEVYPHGMAVTEHLQNVGDVLGRALDGPCKVHKFYASGPAKELEIIKPLLDPLGSVTYFASIQVEDGDVDEKERTGNGVSHVANIRDFAASEEEDDDDDDRTVESFVILPVFKVHDWDKVETQFMRPLLAVAKDEAGCVYFSFARNADQNLLLVREKYVHVEAALLHLEKAAPILASCIAEGIVELAEASVYGTESAIEASKSAFDPFGTQYRTILHALDRFQVASSPSCPLAALE
jgi:quinol monooxygenase YgiN